LSADAVGDFAGDICRARQRPKVTALPLAEDPAIATARRFRDFAVLTTGAGYRYGLVCIILRGYTRSASFF
jgi:hypothetical protein